MMSLPVFLYDDHCKLCTAFVKRFVNKVPANKKDSIVSFIPIREADPIKKKFQLSEKKLLEAVHFISSEGLIYQGELAIEAVLIHYSWLKKIPINFKSIFIKRLYQYISKYRYKILGYTNKPCYKECSHPYKR